MPLPAPGQNSASSPTFEPCALLQYLKTDCTCTAGPTAFWELQFFPSAVCDYQHRVRKQPFKKINILVTVKRKHLEKMDFKTSHLHVWLCYHRSNIGRPNASNTPRGSPCLCGFPQTLPERAPFLMALLISSVSTSFFCPDCLFTVLKCLLRGGISGATLSFLFQCVWLVLFFQNSPTLR